MNNVYATMCFMSYYCGPTVWNT